MPLRPAALLVALPLLLGACRNDTIVTYRIPKEASTDASAAHATPTPPNPDQATSSVPVSSGTHDLTWTAPASWQSKPGGSVRKGSYVIGPASGPTADLSITAFPGDVGGDLANVNRWRSQIGLGPISAAEFPGTLTHLDSGGLHIDYVDLAHNGTRMLAAIAPHEGATWFVKLTGPDALVAAEKFAFIDFLKTLRPAP